MYSKIYIKNRLLFINNIQYTIYNIQYIHKYIHRLSIYCQYLKKI
jgi:hypothetical protein